MDKNPVTHLIDKVRVLSSLQAPRDFLVVYRNSITIFRYAVEILEQVGIFLAYLL